MTKCWKADTHEVKGSGRASEATLHHEIHRLKLQELSSRSTYRNIQSISDHANGLSNGGMLFGNPHGLTKTKVLVTIDAKGDAIVSSTITQGIVRLVVVAFILGSAAAVASSGNAVKSLS